MFRAITITLLAGLVGCTQATVPADGGATRLETIRTEAPPVTAHPELEFFNSLSARLEVEATAPPEKVGGLENVRAAPGAGIKSLVLTAEVFNRDTETSRELTAEERQSVAFRGPQITLRGESEVPVTHQAPNGEFFTVQDLLKAVAETERQTRDKTEWLGGVDLHHVFFEGIHPGEDGVWDIYWGS